ncbi:PQQ-like beta-propeller repeat protein [Sphingomonas montanisoli]|uniref:PQQ-binding-like beta-propeller repeat protein n=1 Tax=Sphingomonas montanisoli TaxID=2606412 RepID=A0A5D9C6P5_9SPHN|nr:PQQ-binding-like beta-propeller repeat protein [Sphingomonas montanisoli]TZG27193.1 PQQ-binding-like beta-propeller repeat protein [Sphingomonas montanisoli]
MRRILPLVCALMIVPALSGCGIFKGGDGKKSRTPVMGQRIAILTAESGAETDPALAEVPVVVPPEAPNDAWAQPGGNGAHSMGNPALGQSLSVAWTRKIAGSSKKARLGAAPVIAGGRVYVLDIDAVVHALDLKTGGEIWRQALPDKDGNKAALFGGGVSFDGGKVYATNGVGDVGAFDATTGTLLWSKRPGGPLRGAPSIAFDTVYVMSQDNQLFALKAADGATMWTASGSLENSAVFGVAAPAIAQGTVVAGFSSGELSAFRYENGRAVWQDALSRTSITTSVASLVDIDAAPVVDQGHVYAIGQGGRMVSMDLNTGQRLWELNVAGIETPWIAGEWLFVLTDDAKIVCIARNSGKVRWLTQLPRWKKEKKRRGAINWSGPTLAGGRLLVTNTRGEMLTLSVDEGRVVSTTKTGGTAYFAPVVAEGTAVLLLDDGKLIAYR